MEYSTLFKEVYFRSPKRNITSEAELIEILKAFKKEMRLIWFEKISDQNSVLNRVYKAFKEDSDFILFDESKTKINIPELIGEIKRYKTLPNAQPLEELIKEANK